MSEFKVKITHPGVNTREGEIKVGQVITIDGVGDSGDELPGFLVNKCVIVGDNDGRELHADNAEIDALKKQLDDLTADNTALKEKVDAYEAAELKALKDEYKTLTGKEPDGRMKLIGLREELAKLKAPKA